MPKWKACLHLKRRRDGRSFSTGYTENFGGAGVQKAKKWLPEGLDKLIDQVWHEVYVLNTWRYQSDGNVREKTSNLQVSQYCSDPMWGWARKYWHQSQPRLTIQLQCHKMGRRSSTRPNQRQKKQVSFVRGGLHLLCIVPYRHDQFSQNSGKGSAAKGAIVLATGTMTLPCLPRSSNLVSTTAQKRVRLERLLFRIRKRKLRIWKLPTRAAGSQPNFQKSHTSLTKYTATSTA